MTESVEGGASLAWRLLATLEGGSLLLATSALLAYTARARVARNRRRHVRRVLITDTSNPLGRELKSKLEACSCTVSTLTGDASSGRTSGADEVDAVVVVGAEPRQHTLNHVAEFVSEDVYHNLRLLESVSPRLRAGGVIAWASAGASSGAYRGAIAAFDNVLRASVAHVANVSGCEAIWIGRGESAARVVDRVVAELTNNNEVQHAQGYSIRNAVHKVSEYLGRWLKIIT